MRYSLPTKIPLKSAFKPLLASSPSLGFDTNIATQAPPRSPRKTEYKKNPLYLRASAAYAELRSCHSPSETFAVLNTIKSQGLLRSWANPLILPVLFRAAQALVDAATPNKRDYWLCEFALTLASSYDLLCLPRVFYHGQKFYLCGTLERLGMVLLAAKASCLQEERFYQSVEEVRQRVLQLYESRDNSEGFSKSKFSSAILRILLQFLINTGVARGNYLQAIESFKALQRTPQNLSLLGSKLVLFRCPVIMDLVKLAVFHSDVQGFSTVLAEGLSGRGVAFSTDQIRQIFGLGASYGQIEMLSVLEKLYGLQNLDGLPTGTLLSSLDRMECVDCQNSQYNAFLTQRIFVELAQRQYPQLLSLMSRHVSKPLMNPPSLFIEFVDRFPELYKGQGHLALLLFVRESLGIPETTSEPDMENLERDIKNKAANFLKMLNSMSLQDETKVLFGEEVKRVIELL